MSGHGENCQHYATACAECIAEYEAARQRALGTPTTPDDLAAHSHIGSNGVRYVEYWLAEEMADRLQSLEAALRDIVDPLAALRRDADAKSAKLSGMAYSIANDPEHLKRLARAALKGQSNG